MKDLPAFRRVFQQFPGAAALLEGPGHVVSAASEPFAALLGGAVHGLPLAQAVPELAEQGVLARIDAVAATSLPLFGAQARLRSRGPAGERWVECACAPLRGESGVVALALWLSDVTGHTRAEDALRRSEERLSLAQSAGGVGTFDWDIQGGRVLWTEQEERLFGLEPGGFEGTIEGWSRRVHPDDGAASMAQFAACWAERREETVFEFRIFWPSGEVRWIAGGGRFFYAEDGTPLRMVGVNIDITARKVAQEERDRVAERTRRLLAVTAALAEATTLEEAARTIVQEGAAGLGASGGLFVRPIDGGSKLELVHAVGYSEAVVRGWNIYDATAEMPTAQVFRTAEPLFLESRDEAFARFPGLRDTAEPWVRAWMVVPIVSGGRSIGVLTFRYDQHDRAWDADDRGFIFALAQQGAVALERARLFEAERTARQRVQVLADAGTALASTLDLQGTLDGLARLVVPAVADWCFVEMPRPDGSIAPVVAYHTDPAQVAVAKAVQARFPVDPDAPYGTGSVLRTGEPELVPDLPDEVLVAVAHDDDHLAALRRMAFVSHVSLPLTVRGRTLGVLSLVTAESGRRFGPDDMPFVAELARRAALSIDNARLFEAEQEARLRAERAADRSRRLRDVAAALNQAATPEQVAEVCVVHGMAALGGAAGSFATLVDEGAAVEIVFFHGYADEVSQRWRRFPVVAGRPLSDAVLTRAPVLVGSRREWSALYPAASADAVRGELVALAIVPIIMGDQPLGAVSFSFAGEQQFDEADRTFLGMLGEQAVQALERARLLETERRARAEAEEANRAKTEFLSAMSHELRTPLNAIAGYTDLLDLGVHGPVTDQQVVALSRIKRAQEVLLSLINDVLNYARVEAGRLEVAREPVGVGESLAALEPLIAPQVAARALVYACEPCGADVAVMGDAERIRQILLNLLSNAVKFTDRGGSVRVWAERAGDQVAIHVADTGRGVPADKLESIFDPFVQLDRHRTEDSQQGVGLGLAISRELARAMGGDLAARSEPGQGSTFTLTLAAADQG